MELFGSAVTTANGILWGVPMVAALLAAGGWFSLRTGFFQLRHIPLWFRSTIKPVSSGGDGELTPLQAMTSALAATLGNGNIAGVAVALTMGGAGAVFWMWVSAILGMMTGYAENVLGAVYRRKTPSGMQGGAMYYIRDGLSQRRFVGRLAKPLSAVFAAACILSAFGTGNLVQVNSAAQVMRSGFGIPQWVTGAALAVCIGFIALGGRRSKKGGMGRAASVTSGLVPLMSAFYIAGAVFILAANITRLPDMLGMIFRSAFGLEAAAGGVNGYMVKQAVSMGFRRGVFSNEAGLGTSVTAHSCSGEKEPCIIGMWSIFEVFFDTLVMCSLTAFVLLASPCHAVTEQEAFNTVSLSPQYFRLTDESGLLCGGTPVLTVGGGEEQHFLTIYGDSFTQPISHGGNSFSNVMRLTGVQAQDGTGAPLFSDEAQECPVISGVLLEEVTGAELVTLAFSSVFGGAAGKLLSAAAVLFALSTLTGRSGFGAGAAVFLFGERARLPFLVIFTAFTAVGAVVDISAAWGAADLFNGVMAAVNLPVVLCLSGTVMKEHRRFTSSLRRKRGILR